MQTFEISWQGQWAIPKQSSIEMGESRKYA